ncbi:lectin-like [Pholidichthys leucotaenia]
MGFSNNIMILVKVISVSLMLCTILSLNHADEGKDYDKDDKPQDDGMNSSMSRSLFYSSCRYKRKYCAKYSWAYCPECDEYGYYLPQQCWEKTGYCWCVNKITGKKIPNTLTKPWMTPFNCDEEPFCPDGWTWYDNKCYRFINAPKTWPEAQMYCQFDGANLASVHSQEDDHYLRSLTKVDHDFPETWIGGTDAVMMDFWMWSDGTKFYYDNWDHEHHRQDERGCCLKMNYHYDWKWAPAACNATLPFICAKSL